MADSVIDFFQFTIDLCLVCCVGNSSRMKVSLKFTILVKRPEKIRFIVYIFMHLSIVCPSWMRWGGGGGGVGKFDSVAILESEEGLGMNNNNNNTPPKKKQQQQHPPQKKTTTPPPPKKKKQQQQHPPKKKNNNNNNTPQKNKAKQQQQQQHPPKKKTTTTTPPQKKNNNNNNVQHYSCDFDHLIRRMRLQYIYHGENTELLSPFPHY